MNEYYKVLKIPKSTINPSCEGYLRNEKSLSNPSIELMYQFLDNLGIKLQEYEHALNKIGAKNFNDSNGFRLSELLLAQNYFKELNNKKYNYIIENIAAEINKIDE